MRTLRRIKHNNEIIRNAIKNYSSIQPKKIDPLKIIYPHALIIMKKRLKRREFDYMFKRDIQIAAKKESFEHWTEFMNNFLILNTVPEFREYCLKNYNMNYSLETYYCYYRHINKSDIKKTGIKYNKTQRKWNKIAKNAGYKDLEDMFFKYPGSIYQMALDLEINMNILYKRRSELKNYRFYKKTLDIWLHIV